jgi:peptidoglycan/LPS O-acetylase OafA/YrhL
MLFHASNMFHKGPIFQHGYLAVDLFFMLSGFVIALSYEERLKAGSGLPGFLQSRGRRLLPVYWIGAAFNLAVFFWMLSSGYYPSSFSGVAAWLIVPLTTLLMLPAFGAPGNSFSPAMMNVNWSLMIEWIVNIGYGAFGFRLRTRTLVLLTLACWAAMTVAGYHHDRGWCLGITRSEVLTFGMMRGVPSFLAGVVLYRLHTRPWFTRMPVIAPELLLTLWLCIASYPTFSATPTYDWITATILNPALMMLMLRAEGRAPAFCAQLGRISYPLYVVHPGFILLAQGTPLFGLNNAPNALRAGFVMLLCLGAAWVVAAIADMLPRGLPFAPRKSAPAFQP